MSLHIPTLFQVMVASSATMAVAIAFLAREPHRDLRPWALALALQAGAYALFGLRGQVHDLWSIVLGNGLLVAALALFTESLLRFQRRPVPRWLVWSPVGLVVLGMLPLMENFPARTLLSSGVFGLQCLSIAGLVWQWRRVIGGQGQYLLMAGALLVGMLVLTRLLLALTGLVETSRLDEPSLMQSATFLSALLGTLLLTVGLLMMAQERAERALRDSERLYRQLVEAVNEGICVVQAGQLRFVNPRMQQLMGCSEHELLGRDLLSFVQADDHQRVRDMLERRLHGDAEDLRIELRAISRNTRVRWLELSGRRVDWQGQPAILNLVSDITGRQEEEEKIRDLAYHDALTQLPNRRLFLEHLHHAQATTKRQGRHAAVIYLDLDNFKSLNDRWGHHVGDLLLIEVARRIQQTLREVDTVARFGGDEFVVLLNELSAERGHAVEQVQRIADKLVQTLGQTYRLKAKPADAAPEAEEIEIEHRCTASLGVAVFAGDSSTSDRLLDLADAAMYRAKNAGRNRYELADEAEAPTAA